MAPDRGANASTGDEHHDGKSGPGLDSDDHDANSSASSDESTTQKLTADRSSQPQNFTLRGIILGLSIGLIIAFSNTYFGLQTGWVSGMSMPSALIAFAVFKVLGPYLKTPFSPVENVLVQTVAGSVGTMPLGCGFVGVIPALEFLLNDEEGGGLRIGTGRLVLWAVGVCLFGVVFAVPLRKEVIIREKLKFPSGTATALMIGVLHGDEKGAFAVQRDDEGSTRGRKDSNDERRGLMEDHEHDSVQRRSDEDPRREASQADLTQEPSKNPTGVDSSEWKSKIRSMVLAFASSGVYTIVNYFIPQLRALPIFGHPLGRNWLWTLNPSPAYVGQGIIMGPATTAHMLFGAILGWAVLSPIAKSKGWAPGPVGDWETGSKGWIVWISLSIMLADALVSLGWLILRPLLWYARVYGPSVVDRIRISGWQGLKGLFVNGSPSAKDYTALNTSTDTTSPTQKPIPSSSDPEDEPEPDAPPSQLISTRTFLISASLSVALYYASLSLTFPHLLTPSLTTLALLLALLLSLLGVRALGSTDLNPVSGISKLTQLIFALLPAATASSSAISINLVAGAVSESGALQAGDLLQDLKTGHLLGASPAAQFYGQVVGSVVGAAASAVIYRLYASVYTIPSAQFQVPTAYVWIFTARLVTGAGLPAMAAPMAFAFAALWSVLTVVRLVLKARANWAGSEKYVPGGIAVAVGMYNTPSFTLARAVGGLVSWWWVSWRERKETGVIVLASGLILGEGVGSIFKLGLAWGEVPTLGDGG